MGDSPRPDDLWWLPESAGAARHLSDSIDKLKDLWWVPRRVEIARELRAHNDPVMDLSGFHFIQDSGTLSGATELAAEDTDITDWALDDAIRLHIQIDETNNGPANNLNPTLRYRVDGGSWITASTTTSVQLTSGNNDLTDGQTIASGDRRCAAPASGSYLGGEVDFDGSTGTYSFAGDDYIEVCFIILADSGQLNGGEVIEFDVLLDTTPTDNQSATYPQATLAAAATQGAASLSASASISAAGRVDHQAVAALSAGATLTAAVPPSYVDYYVDTVNGSSGNGGTDPDTDAWDSLVTAESTINGRDLVTNNEIGRIFCVGSTADAAVDLNPTAGYTDADHYWEIHGEGASTTYSTSIFRIENTTEYDCLDVQAGFFRFIDIQCKSTNTQAVFTTCIQNAGTGTVWIDRAYLWGDAAGSGTDSVECVRNQGGGTVYLRNVIGDGSNNYHVFDNASGTMVAHNCVAANAADNGFDTVECYNCIGYGNGTNDFDAGSTGNYNASQDSTAPGANSLTTIADPFLSYSATIGSSNFALDTSADEVTGAGTDLSSDANLPVTVDIDEQARPSNPDMGVDQAMFYSAAALSGQATITATLTSASTTVQGVASLSGTATVTASGRVDHLGLAALSGAATMSATALRTRLPSASLSGTAAMSATALRTRLPSASLSGTAAITATSQVARPGVAALSGTATMSATALRTRLPSAALSGAATMSATALRTRLPSASLSGTATVAAAGRVDHLAVASLSGTATVTATPSTQGVVGGAASLSATATVAAVGRADHLAASSLSGSASLSAISRATRPGSASLSGAATVSASGLKTARSTAALSGTATVAALSSPTRRTSSALGAAATLSATGRADHLATASLSGTATVYARGTGTGQILGAASLSATATLSASALRTRLPTASLSGAATITATATIIYPTISGAASLSATAALAATPHYIARSTFSAVATASITAVLSPEEEIDYVQVGDVFLTHAVGVGRLTIEHTVGASTPSVAASVNTGRITCRAL